MDTKFPMPAHQGMAVQPKRVIHKVQSMDSRQRGLCARGMKLKRSVSTSQSARSTDLLLDSVALEMGSKGSECGFVTKRQVIILVSSKENRKELIELTSKRGHELLRVIVPLVEPNLFICREKNRRVVPQPPM